jgi:hypothetical protein
MTSPPTPETEHPTPASVWPMVAAAGLTAILFGLVTWTPAFSVLGIVMLLAGIAGWVKELADGSSG